MVLCSESSDWRYTSDSYLVKEWLYLFIFADDDENSNGEDEPNDGTDAAENTADIQTGAGVDDADAHQYTDVDQDTDVDKGR